MKNITGEDYYANLPKKRMGAGAIILDSKGRILIVKPAYKDHWSLPGGVVDSNESPQKACLREIKEEIGLKVQKLRFLCVDYILGGDNGGENLQFVFYGGKLNKGQIKKIAIPKKEISEFRFMSKNEALKLLSPKSKKRTVASFKALNNNCAAYLENK